VCAARVWRTVEIEGWPGPEVDMAEHAAGVLPQAQRMVCDALAASRADALRARFDPAAAPTAALRAQALSHRARLLSVADSAESAWLDAMPTCAALTLSDDDLAASARFRLGLSPHPDTTRPVRCKCGAALSRANPDNALVCPRVAGATTARHNILQQAWRRVAFCNGVATSIEPVYAHLAPPGHVPFGTRGDVLFATTRDIVVGDVAEVHPGGNTVVERACWG
jgi:hypothetical protein